VTISHYWTRPLRLLIQSLNNIPFPFTFYRRPTTSNHPLLSTHAGEQTPKRPDRIGTPYPEATSQLSLLCTI